VNKNLISVDVLESWLKAYEKAKAAHQSLSRLDDDASSVSESEGLLIVLEDSELFQVCDAFDAEATKRWQFQPTRKAFECDSAPSSMVGDAKSRSNMLRQRYWVVAQRLQRSTATHFGEVAETPLIAIESLVGSSGVKRVMGMISQMEEGKWYLEDAKTAIELDFSALSPSEIHAGFYTEGSICVAEGEVLRDRDAFRVTSLSFGAAESKEMTEKTFPSTDFFGTGMDHRLKERALKYETMYAESGSDGFLVLSDVWLDDAKVFEKLKFVISGANTAPPFALVLLGNFTSPSRSTSMTTYIDCFEKLADVLATAGERLLRSTRLIFVPGPNDPTASRDVLPTPALSKPIREAFEKRIRRGIAHMKAASSSSKHNTNTGGDNNINFITSWPEIHFTSNPVRLRYCTKQLVFFRQDVTNKLRRHCFLTPSSSSSSSSSSSLASNEEHGMENSLSDHLVRTICDQSHLCPLPITTKPAFWNYDHALRLYPLPDIVRDASLVYWSHRRHILSDLVTNPFHSTFSSLLLATLAVDGKPSFEMCFEKIAVSDQSTRFVIEYEGTKTMSPGAFAIDSTFASISPLTGQITEYSA